MLIGLCWAPSMTPQELVYRNRLPPPFRAFYEERVIALVKTGLNQEQAESEAVWETIRQDGCNIHGEGKAKYKRKRRI